MPQLLSVSSSQRQSSTKEGDHIHTDAVLQVLRARSQSAYMYEGAGSPAAMPTT